MCIPFIRDLFQRKDDAVKTRSVPVEEATTVGSEASEQSSDAEAVTVKRSRPQKGKAGNRKRGKR